MFFSVKLRKPVLSVLQLLLALVCVAAFAGAACAQDPIWNNAGYYEISNASQLAAFRDWVNSGTNADASYRLTADIDLAGVEWTPIGLGTYDIKTRAWTYDRPFRGKFDGGGFEISNFRIEKLDAAYSTAGLFGYVASGGGGIAVVGGGGESIKNLKIRDFVIDLTRDKTDENVYLTVGGLVGWNAEVPVESISVEGSVKITSKVTSPNAIGKSYVLAGGLVGRNYADIRDAASNCDITVAADTSGLVLPFNPSPDIDDSTSEIFVGGLVGGNTKGSITGSSSRSDIDATVLAEVSATEVGGLVGYTYASLDNCSASGRLTVSADNMAYVDIGGLAGYAKGFKAAPAVISSSDSSVEVGVSAYNVDAGGLIGCAYGGMSINGSVASGSVDVKAIFSYAGGLVGLNHRSLNFFADCKAQGDVTVETLDPSQTANRDDFGNLAAGGLVGRSSGSIVDSVAEGVVTVKGGDAVKAHLRSGGFAGFNEGIISGGKALGKASAESGEPGSNAYVGGFAGENNGEIDKCNAIGDVRSNADRISYAGGLIGSNRGEVDYSYATGDVYAEAGDGQSRVLSGGLVGFNRSQGTINGCTSGGDVTTRKKSASTGQSFVCAGGHVGVNSGKITSSYAAGTVYAETASDAGDVVTGAGGFVGGNNGDKYMTGTIADCYATGNASASGVTGLLQTQTVAAGFAGGANFWSEIVRCYSYGKVVGSNALDSGFIAGNHGDVEGCFWLQDGDVNAALRAIAHNRADFDQTARAQGIEKSAFSEAHQATFENEGWDFASVWCYVEEDGGAMPHLRSAEGISPDSGDTGSSSGCAAGTGATALILAAVASLLLVGRGRTSRRL